MRGIKQTCFFLLIVSCYFRLASQTNAYQKEQAKANKWNESQYRIIKTQFNSLTGCSPDKVKITIVQSQYTFNGASRYGQNGFNASQEAHDKALAKRVYVSGCGKDATYSFGPGGKWIYVEKLK